jgi:hypothetical protein
MVIPMPRPFVVCLGCANRGRPDNCAEAPTADSPRAEMADCFGTLPALRRRNVVKKVARAQCKGRALACRPTRPFSLPRKLSLERAESLLGRLAGDLEDSRIAFDQDARDVRDIFLLHFGQSGDAAYLEQLA